MAIMIDFETLGLTPDAFVLSLGACVFDVTKQETREQLQAKSRIWYFTDHQPGRVIEPNTVRWWLEQSPEAKKRTFDAVYKQPIKDVIDEFSILWTENNDHGELWSNGPSFDGAILESLTRQVKTIPVWTHTSHRDVRTLGSIAGMKFKNIDGVAHDAMSDTIEQALFVQRCFAKIHDSRT